MDPHGLLGEPAEELRAVGHLALGLGQGLAHLEADQLGEVVRLVHDHLERPAQDLPAVARRRRRPVRLRGDRSIQRGHRVPGVAIGHVGDHRVVGRIADLEPGTRVRLTPLPADEQPTGAGLGQEV